MLYVAEFPPQLIHQTLDFSRQNSGLSMCLSSCTTDEGAQALYEECSPLPAMLTRYFPKLPVLVALVASVPR